MRNLTRSRTSRVTAAFATAAVSLAVAAGPAAAQPQSGLINVDVSDNTVQVPIAVAANVCGLQVGIPAQQLRQGPVNCDADADSDATATRGGGGGGGPQEGLVNLAITNNTIQVPIGIAANICGVQAGVLAADLRQGDDTCEAVADPNAEA